MKQVTSAEFRKTYPTLTEAVEVTALGRPIGRYTPISTAIDDRAVAGIRPGEPSSMERAWDTSKPAPKTKK